MFKRKKKEVVLFIDGKSAAPLTKFTLSEKVTIALSIKYFNDPEPCHIHREAVRQRVCMQLMQAYLNKGKIAVCELPVELLDVFPDACDIELKEESI